jgi:hypothetical protein
MLQIGDTYTTTKSNVTGQVVDIAPHSGNYVRVLLAYMDESGTVQSKWTTAPNEATPDE